MRRYVVIDERDKAIIVDALNAKDAVLKAGATGHVRCIFMRRRPYEFQVGRVLRADRIAPAPYKPPPTDDIPF